MMPKLTGKEVKEAEASYAHISELVDYAKRQMDDLETLFRAGSFEESRDLADMVATTLGEIQHKLQTYLNMKARVWGKSE